MKAAGESGIILEPIPFPRGKTEQHPADARFPKQGQDGVRFAGTAEARRNRQAEHAGSDVHRPAEQASAERPVSPKNRRVPNEVEADQLQVGRPAAKMMPGPIGPRSDIVRLIGHVIPLEFEPHDRITGSGAGGRGPGGGAFF